MSAKQRQELMKGYSLCTKDPDELADFYLRHKGLVNEHKAWMDQAKEDLLAIVADKGVIPEGAPKSKRISTILHEITVSYGQSVVVNDDQAQKILDACCNKMGDEAGYQFFARLFAVNTSFLLEKTAEQTLAAPLPAGAPKNLRTLYSKAVSIKPKTPTLNVERAKAEASHGAETVNCISAGGGTK